MIDRAIQAVRAFDKAKALPTDALKEIAEKALSAAESGAEPGTEEWSYLFAKAATRELEAMV